MSRISKAMRNSRAMALLFLQEINHRANDYAVRLDPEELRRYECDPVLRALDGIAATTRNAIATARAAKASPALPHRTTMTFVTCTNGFLREASDALAR